MLSIFKVRAYSFIECVITYFQKGDTIEWVIQMMSNTIGKNIKTLRRKNEVKQDVLASSLHLRRQTVSSYERGITLPSIFTLIRIADFFDVTLDELTGREELRIPEKNSF